MAQLVIKAVSASHPDPVKDRGCYKRGDIIAVFEDSHVFSVDEARPPADGGKFVIVTCTTHTAEQLRALAFAKWGISLDERLAGQEGQRRAIRVDVDALPALVKQQLNTTGRYSATLTQIRNYILHKNEGAL